MDTIEEPQLFGVTPGKVRAASVDFSTHQSGYKCASIYVHTENRNGVMTLTITGAPEQPMAAPLESLVVLLKRSDHLDGSLARRTMWALHQRWGKQGYEVHISGCGAYKGK